MSGELRLADLETARDAGFVEQVKAALDLPADAQLQLRNVTRDAGAQPIGRRVYGDALGVVSKDV